MEIVRCCGQAALTDGAQYHKACGPREFLICSWLVFGNCCWPEISGSLRPKQPSCIKDSVALVINAHYCSQGVAVTGGGHQKVNWPMGGIGLLLAAAEFRNVVVWGIHLLKPAVFQDVHIRSDPALSQCSRTSALSHP